MVVFSNKKVLNLESLHTVFSLRKKCLYSELFWSAFFPHFSAFGLNISLRIQSEWGKIRKK